MKIFEAFKKPKGDKSKSNKRHIKLAFKRGLYSKKLRYFNFLISHTSFGYYFTKSFRILYFRIIDYLFNYFFEALVDNLLG